MNSEPQPEMRTPWWKRPLFHWRMPLMGVLSLVLILLGIHHRRPTVPETEPFAAAETFPAQEEIVIPLPAPLPAWPSFTHPTPQRNWAETENPNIYMPTGSGRVESAGYGSIRTNSSGRAVFHEGVDIAPVEWLRGKAADQVFAAADGRIAYINRVAGNSSYGIYIVIEHTDDVGKVYSVYAHLAAVADGLKVGDKVRGGEEIALMGHTSTMGIPRSRSHLHFEMGMMLNPDFNRWYRAQKKIPDHGNFHGFNFSGFDPRLMLIPLSGKDHIPFSYLNTLQNLEPAWQLLLRNPGRPRYFDLYPKLWEGADYSGKAMVLNISESGIPLAGRNATADELAKLSSSKNLVLSVNEKVLGRNGRRQVVQSGNKWILGSNGNSWLEILLYNAR